jgi:hypothetical protein
MKQFYLLLASVLMLFVGIGSAEAETGETITSLSSLSNSKCYTLTTARGKIVANAAGTDICSGNNSGASSEEAYGQWAILKLNDTSYYLLNVGTKKFLKSTSFYGGDLGDVYTLSEGTTTSGTFLLKSGDNTLNINGEGNIVLNGWSTEDEGNIITIAEAGEFDATIFDSPLTITYNYYINSEKVYSDQKTAYKTLSYPALTTKDYTQATPPSGTVSTDGGTSFDITVSTSLPFEYGTENTAWSDLKWYCVKINDKYVIYDESVSTEKCTLVSAISATKNVFKDKYAFAFIGDPYNGFRIVNYGKGETYTLSNSNNPYDNNTGGSTYPIMKLRTSLNVGTTSGNDVEKYFIAKATNEAFYTQMKTYDGAANTYVSMNNRNSALAYWNTDVGEGSYFTIEQITPGERGETITSLDELVSGQAYTITASEGRGSFIYTSAGLNSTAKTNIAADASDKNQQFMFVKNDDKYYFYSVGAAAYVNVDGQHAYANASAPVNTSLELLTSTCGQKILYPVVLRIDNHDVGISTGYSPSVISFWNSESDAGNALCIKAINGVTYSREELESGRLTDSINVALTEVTYNSRIPVLFSSDDVSDTKAEINAITYSSSDGYLTGLNNLKTIVEKFYKKAEGKKFAIRNTPNTYYLTTTKTELRAKEAELGLDGVFEVKYNGNKKFYLHGVYNDVYVNKPVSYNTAPTTSATATNDFYIGLLDNSADNYVYFANVKSGYNSFHFSTSYTYYTCGWTYDAGNSQWTISAVSDEDYNNLTPWNALTDAIEMAEKYTFGSALGQYGDGSSLETAKSMLEAKSATAAEVSAVIAAIAPSKLKLNMPANGQFLRIKDSAGNYMTCKNTSESRIEFSSTKDDNTIFCYTGSALVAFETGYYASSSSDFPCNATAVGSETVYHIHASSLNKGKYLVSFGGDTRFMFTAANAGTFSNGPTTVNQAGYEFELEEVETVPVTITEAGMGTLYSPMALTIPDGVTAYTGTLDTENSCIKLTALEGTIPANTGVIIEGNATTYNFATTTTTASESSTNCITGSTPGIACVSNAYTLQKVNNELGFYKYSGTNLGGFKAYLVNNNSSSSKGYKIVKDTDPTGINGVEAEGIADGKYYDLQGKIVTTPLKNQIYILNGKKVLIK